MCLLELLRTVSYACCIVAFCIMIERNIIHVFVLPLIKTEYLSLLLYKDNIFLPSSGVASRYTMEEPKYRELKPWHGPGVGGDPHLACSMDALGLDTLHNLG